MKSGYIAAKKQGSDGRWIVRFDRATPKEGQSKSWYVKLREGDPEPFVSDSQLKKFDKDLLVELDPLGGCDYYEHVFAQTSKSDQTYTPAEPEGASVKLDNPVVFEPSPISDYSAALIVYQSWKTATSFCSYKDEKDVFIKMKQEIQLAMAADVCNLMNKCEVGDPNLFETK